MTNSLDGTQLIQNNFLQIMEFVTIQKSNFERILMTLDRLNDSFTEGGEIICHH